MSYTILYKSMFVELSNGKYIPMMEIGDNNVYEANYGRGKARRARSWSNTNLHCGEKFFTKDGIVSALNVWNDECEVKRERDRQSEDEYNRKCADTANFGYYEAIALYGKDCWGTSFADIKRIVLNGIKNSISFADAVRHCGLHITYWEKREGDTYLTSQKSFRFETEEEMYSFIEEKFGEGKGYYFIFDSNKVDDYYDMKKAVKSFTKLNGKYEKFKVECYDNAANRYYLTIKDDAFVLVENIEDGMWFNKHKSNGVDLGTLVFKVFRDKINSVSFRRECHLISA